MNNIKYGGIYWVDNLIDIGRIYLRFFRNGTVLYLITSDIEINDKVFNLLQRNYNNNIDVVKYHMKNDVIEFMINTKIGILQLSGKVNNDSIILNIANTTTRTDVVKNIIFSYYNKQYSNINDNKINTQTKISKSKKIKMKRIICNNCGGTEFANYQIVGLKNEFIGFMCTKCRTAYTYENNLINVLDIGKIGKTNEVKTKEKIPGGPQMARSLNGFSYRSIAKWRNH